MRLEVSKTFKPVKLVRVNRRLPCPICKKTDWCSVGSNGAFVVCMRISEGSVKKSQGGGYIHISKGVVVEPEIKTTFVQTPLAKVPHLHRVYSHLIRYNLSLNPKHLLHLTQDRGLSDSVIKDNCYVSCPSFKAYRSVMNSLTNKFGNALKGVPGFYKKEDKWEMVRYSGGIILPCRDSVGRIRGMQIRKSYGEPRYVWFSSPPDIFEDGTSSGTSIHYSRPSVDSKQIVITEGILKADIINYFLKLPVVGLPGIMSVKTEVLTKELKGAFPKLQKVIIAYDMDWRHNKMVKRAIVNIGSALEKDYETRIRTWDSELYKGMDDILFHCPAAKFSDYTLHDFKLLTNYEE